MRCFNCGWNNPDSETRCQKCNQPLKKNLSAAPAPVPQPVRCVMCGNTVEPGVTVCPCCGSPIEAPSSSPVSSPATVDNHPSPDNRATSYLNLNDQPSPAQAVPMPTMPSQPQACKATVVAAPGTPASYQPQPQACKATVLAAPGTPAYQQSAPAYLSAPTNAGGLSVRLTCLDAPIQGTIITINSSRPLDLKYGTVVLIGEQRYRVE